MLKVFRWFEIDGQEWQLSTCSQFVQLWDASGPSGWFPLAQFSDEFKQAAANAV